jgi:hypothetical protein
VPAIHRPSWLSRGCGPCDSPSSHAWEVMRDA